MNSRDIVSNCPPPGGGGPVILEWQPRPGQPGRGVILSHNSIGHMVHWVPDDRAKGTGRTRPCTRHLGQCIYCLPPYGWSPLWYCWVTVLRAGFDLPSVLKVGRTTVTEEERLHPRWQGSLRGCEFNARRMGTARNSPILVEIGDTPVRVPASLPGDIDRVAWLLRLWGYEDRKALAPEVAGTDHLPVPGFDYWAEHPATADVILPLPPHAAYIDPATGKTLLPGSRSRPRSQRGGES